MKQQINNTVESPTKKINEPKKYLKQNSYTHEILKIQLTYFLADKQNNSGILNNQRFFILYGNQYFGYARTLLQSTSIPFNSITDIPELKHRIPIEDIIQVLAKGNSIILKFTIIEKLEPVEKKWFIKFNNGRTQEKIKQKINEAMAKRKEQLLREKLNLNKENKEKDEKQDYKFLNVNENNKQDIAINTVNPEVNLNNFGTFGIQVSQEQQKIVLPQVPMKNIQQIKIPEIKMDTKQQYEIQQPRKPKIIESTNKKSTIIQYKQSQPIEPMQFKTYDQPIISSQFPQWNYQFLKQQQYDIVFQFKTYSQRVVTKLINELCLPESKRVYRSLESNEDQWLYQINNLVIRLCFTGLKEVRLLEYHKQTVYYEKISKIYNNQFKNFDYILKATSNKGKVRVPLSMIIQYKGIVVFVKAKISEDTRSIVNISSEIEILSRESRIKKQIFEDSDALKIVPLNSKQYEKFSRKEPTTVNKNVFNICYVDQVKYFLPQDFLFIQKQPENKRLRHQYIQDQCFVDKMFIGADLIPYLHKLKIQKGIQQSIQTLADASRGLINKIDELVEDLDNSDQFFISSQELSSILHSRGINMRYLGLIYEKCTISHIKKLCMSEIIARVAKTILRVNLQQLLKTHSQDMQISKNTHSNQREMAIGKFEQLLLQLSANYLNSIVSETSQSQNVWNAINKQAQYAFSISVNKKQINQGYFLQALIFHASLRINWNLLENNPQLFRSKPIFKPQYFDGFRIRSKSYDLSFTDLYSRVEIALEQETSQNFQLLKGLLNLRKFNIPQHFKLNKTVYQRIAVYLAGFIKPKSNEFDVNILPSSSLYQLSDQQPPSITSIRIAILQIKWALKQNLFDKAVKQFEKQVTKINRWCGSNHILLNELYNIFSQYYLHSGDFQQSIFYSKLSVSNTIEILGSDHIKTAEAYFQLAQIYYKWSKKQDSLLSFKKSKIIFENKKKTDLIAYAQISYKVGLLNLSTGKIKEVKQPILKAVEIYQSSTQTQDFQIQIVQCYQLLSRVYEIEANTQDYKSLSEYCTKQLLKLKNPQNIEKLLNIVIYPYLSSLKQSESQNLIQLIQSIRVQNTATSYMTGLNFLKKILQKQKLISKLSQYFENFEEIYVIILNEAVINRWKGIESQIRSSAQQFVAIIEALVLFLGEGFIIGALNQ